MDSFTQNEWFLIIAFGLFLFAIWKMRQPDEEGLLPDAGVNVGIVEKIILEEFELERNQKLKLGYTEKSIEKQLEGIFQARIKHVITQYGLDGPTGQKIDFDLGHGKVGVEIKLAESVFKAGPQDRMVGQIQAYIKSRYSNDNLLLVIFCEERHIKKRAIQKAIKDRLEGMKVKVLFFKI